MLSAAATRNTSQEHQPPPSLPDHSPTAATHLLIKVLQLCPRELQPCHLRQHSVPPPVVDVADKALDAVHCVERHLALILQQGRRASEAG